MFPPKSNWNESVPFIWLLHPQSSGTTSLVIVSSPVLLERTTLRPWFLSIQITSRPSLLTPSRMNLGHPYSSRNDLNGGNSWSSKLKPVLLLLKILSDIVLETNLDDDEDDDPSCTVRYDSSFRSPPSILSTELSNPKLSLNSRSRSGYLACRSSSPMPGDRTAVEARACGCDARMSPGNEISLSNSVVGDGIFRHWWEGTSEGWPLGFE